MDIRKKVILLVSGGMDSICALYDAHKHYDVVLGVSYDYGAKHNHKEIPFAKYHCDQLKIEHIKISLDFMNQYFESTLLKNGGEIPEGHYQDLNMKQTVVPFRNGIMLSIAAGLAESRQAQGLVIAAHSGDHAIYPDCREDFLKSMSEAINYGTYENIEVLRPFISFDKSQIGLRGKELGIDFSKTWSCYKGGETHCGKCGTCVERIEAFQMAGINDLTIYEI